MKKEFFATLLLVSLEAFGEIQPTLVAHFPMELDAGGTKITETCTGKSFPITQARPVRESMPGAVGQALRFDGSSTFVNALINTKDLSSEAISMELWTAMDNYPMMSVDGTNTDYAVIAGNLKPNANSGFAFVINTRGEYGFQIYINGRLYTCKAGAKLPLYEYVHLQAMANMAEKRVTLYQNGRRTGQISVAGTEISVGTAPFIIGKSYNDIKNDRFYMNAVSGLIDEIKVYSGVPAAPATSAAENEADLSIPSTRFTDEIQRPLFRGMPAAAWTNEPHGLIFHNGKWHLFFQKNGNGAYWGQIVWGHITSTDLTHWTEERPALRNEATFDVKGVWSGCIFKDENFNGGLPTIFYTAVDFAKASMVMATPKDNNLTAWTKNGMVVPQRPNGLSDDFRDPCVFKANGNIYMIVGTGKEGKGAATLHRYNAANNTWSNDGATFFRSPGTGYGAFWEMPYVVEITPGKWLFVVTPLGMPDGVECLYWVGSINADGTFSPSTKFAKEVDLGGFSHHGFGLLSPSITQHNGKTIAIGIVPDMTSGSYMYDRGWGGTYNLPREWSLDAEENLVQKPATDMVCPRSTTAKFRRTGFNLNGSQSLQPVNGKAVEIEGTFTISSNNAQQFGFNLRKNGEQAIKVYYSKANNSITVDATSVPRHVQDAGRFDGIYSQQLPRTFTPGETLKIHAFLDHSILDLFVNDTWAASVRIFATDNDANDVEVFANGGTTTVKSLQAWNWGNDNGNTGTPAFQPEENGKDVFCYGGRLHFKNISPDASISIHDSAGKMLYQGHTGGHTFPLPQNQLLIVRITDKEEIISKKIISF